MQLEQGNPFHREDNMSDNKSRNNNNRAGQRRRLLQAGIGMAAVAAFTPFAVRAAQRELRVGYQKGLLSLLKRRGTLEQRLAPLGVTVKWIEFSAGPVQLEALNVGSIDFGDVGEAPPIFAQANGTPIVYVAATVPRPAVEAVLVPATSAVRTVADLKGKKIALNKGSNVHYFLVKLLQKNGLNHSDVNLVWLAPADARAAFEKGVVDAWVIWEPFLAAAEQTLAARILADASGVVKNRAYYFSSKDYAQKNGDVLSIAVEELNKIDIWGKANRNELAAELSAVWGLPKPVVDVLVARSSFGTEPISRSILAEQQVIADTFFELKLIPRQIDVRDAAPAALGRS
ncbi:ABC transporter, substrate-binding, aliphatic sulfonates family protein [Collimonas fungivorans]|uniref:Putative aliphatic sulfonates-binding protein n=2 Tax=Collimonas fungivorans TaxID=158899 RepID=A0A127PBF6_9BURK|nr:ABC transporter, substrate-binding, aliphatic sulfonates family protein [Collimonas fungivorans]